MTLELCQGQVFQAQVKPNANISCFEGYDGTRDVFKFKLKAVPDKGKANHELIKFLKKEHGLNCEIISGHTSRKKLLKVL